MDIVSDAARSRSASRCAARRPARCASCSTMVLSRVFVLAALAEAASLLAQEPTARYHWPLERDTGDVASSAAAGGRNDLVCQTLPGYPCPTFDWTAGMFPGQKAAAFFPTGPAFSSASYWKGGYGFRTRTPVTLTRARAFTVWWRAAYLPLAPPGNPIDQDQIFGATNNGTGESWYLTFRNASQGWPEVCGPGTSLPVCGPLLSVVFAVQSAEFIQYCTDPRTFEVTLNETHFVGFSSVGIDNSSFVFFFDGRDRTKELVLCSLRGDPAKNDPTGLSLPLRAVRSHSQPCDHHLMPSAPQSFHRPAWAHSLH